VGERHRLVVSNQQLYNIDFSRHRIWRDCWVTFCIIGSMIRIIWNHRLVGVKPGKQPPTFRRLLGFFTPTPPSQCSDIVRICARWIRLEHNQRRGRLLVPVSRRSPCTEPHKPCGGKTCHRPNWYKCVGKHLLVPRNWIVGRGLLLASTLLRRRMGLWNTKWITCTIIEENRLFLCVFNASNSAQS